MHIISLLGSNAQKGKLRNGHKVRVRHGEGFNVIVNPDTYHIVSRAFNKNKGVQIQLSPEEIAMNRNPSPEMQQQIMGMAQPLMIPSVRDHMGGRGLGTGVGDWFKNLGNTIKSGWENTIQKPIEQKIINPAKEALSSQKAKDLGNLMQYASYVGNPLIIAHRMKQGEKFGDILKDQTNSVKNQQFYKDYIKPTEPYIRTASALANPLGTAATYAARIATGEKPMDVIKGAMNDFKQTNDLKNKLIKSNPVTTEMYKKAVPGALGLAAGTAATYAGANPFLGGIAGAAGTAAGNQILKAEGYGLHHHLHHIMSLGERAIHKHMKHFNPIGGALSLKHIRDYFKNMGKKAQEQVMSYISPYAKTAKDKLKLLHEYILSNPELGNKVKEHGTKLAGILAKEGVKYLTGSKDLGDLAGEVGETGGKEALNNYTDYGKERPRPKQQLPPDMRYLKPTPPAFKYNPPPKFSDDIRRQFGAPEYDTGSGLYAGRQRGSGLYGGVPPMAGGSMIKHFGVVNAPPSRLVGEGFESFHTLHQATIDNAKANHRLAQMQDNTVNLQHHVSPIKSYWDEEGQPLSRGYGIHHHKHGKVHHKRKAGFEKHNHFNLVRGKGAILEHKSVLPPALQSQPYGANFHMQNMLPPQYQKYNDGTNEY